MAPMMSRSRLRRASGRSCSGSQKFYFFEFAYVSVVYGFLLLIALMRVEAVVEC